MKRIKHILKEEFMDQQQRSKKVERIIQEIIFDAIKDSVYLLKVDKSSFRYVAINEAALAITGLTKQCIGKNIEDVHYKPYARHLQNKFTQVVKSGKPLYCHERVCLVNGYFLYGESIITPVIDEEGICHFLVSITRNITESVKEKNKLIESEQRYRSLFDHNLDPIFSLDDQGCFISVNPSTSTITGYSQKELLSLSIFHFILEEDKKMFLSIFQKTLKGSSKETTICKIVNRENQILTLQVKTVPIVVNERITGVYVIARDITKQSKNEQMIKHMAYHDDLTGLPNRFALKEKLHETIKSAKQQQSVFALMYVDLDRFKFLNDTMGHNIGDLLLKKVAKRLKKVLKADYTVFRQGGDEFIVLLNKAGRKLAEYYAQKLQTAFSQPFVLNKKEFFITPSIGISLFPLDGEDDETLIKNADTALYRVKERGKGHFRFYTEDMQKGTPKILEMELGLRKAVQKDELVLYYQPQIDLKTMKINSFEALLRWNSKTLGFISPSDFIPLAEETGLIIPIGNWVIRQVCSQLRKWNEEGMTNVTVALNLSTRQFHQTDIVTHIKQAIIDYKIDPNCIEIEITEGAMQDAKEAVIILNQLKEIGVQVSIDDFGTGYSSLAHLKRFPIDTLKIDKSFIRDLLIDEDSEAIVKTIIHMAKILGLNVIAEGVEHKEQVKILQTLNCEKVQGFLFSKPVSCHKIKRRFLHHKQIHYKKLL